jgi:hypothetical protein
MKYLLLALGLCGSLLVTPAVADERGETALGSAPGGADKAVTGKQTEEETGAVTGGAGGGASDTAVTTEEKGEAEAVAGRGRASGAAAGKPKRAGTGTAAGYINDQVKKGNVKIQGATDADIYD